jgi:hypothetical protein
VHTHVALKISRYSWATCYCSYIVDRILNRSRRGMLTKTGNTRVSSCGNPEIDTLLKILTATIIGNQKKLSI